MRGSFNSEREKLNRLSWCEVETLLAVDRQADAARRRKALHAMAILPVGALDTPPLGVSGQQRTLVAKCVAKQADWADASRICLRLPRWRNR